MELNREKVEQQGDLQGSKQETREKETKTARNNSYF
jgi:hypothetical protein